MATLTNKQVPNKYGRCPACSTSWDGGNIKQVLEQMDISMFRTDQVGKMAESYGYTDENQKRFTNTIGIQIGEDHYFQCPNCRKIWDMEGNVFNSVIQIYDELKEPVA